MTRPIKKKKRLSSFQIIILGFVGVILLGALLLMLPISSRGGVVTPFNQTLFTSTSAVCVTGLFVRDTATHWSLFGRPLSCCPASDSRSASATPCRTRSPRPVWAVSSD